MNLIVKVNHWIFQSGRMKRIVSCVLTLWLIVVSLNFSVAANAVTLQLGTESFEGASIPNGWYAAYGGNISLSNDCAKSGNKSLKITNRGEAWHSPAINIYDTVKANGSGRYVISLWVRTNAIIEDANKCRLIIRGTEENSFFEKSGNNYFIPFYPFKYMQPNEWAYLTGTIDIYQSDIDNSTSHEFNVMFDVLAPAVNQAVYIDDFSITKQATPIEGIYFESSVYYLKPYDRDGEIVYATACVDPRIAGENETINYYSSDTSVVTVHATSGRLSAQKAGTATVTAYLESDPTITATCTVEVGYQYYAYNYYDKGFKVRYGANAEGAIEVANNYVRSILKDYFNVSVTYNYEEYESIIDECKGTITTDNFNTVCTRHNPPCTDAMHMYDEFVADNRYYVSGNISTVVVWSGHHTTWGDNEDRSFWFDKNGNGAGEIFMLKNSEYSSQLAPIYLHETAHALGAKDHYHEPIDGSGCKNIDICSECGINKRDARCIMNGTRYALIDTPAYLICEPCKQEIFAHLNDHH